MLFQPLMLIAIGVLAQSGTTYQVPAGAHLAIELRTSIDSEHASPGDQVDGVVTTAIHSGETEVVPSGAPVHGAVTEARPRTKRAPGRLVFSFTVLQHPVTKSRIGIRTTAVTIEGQAAERHGLKTTPPTDAVVRAGDRVDVTLLEPFLVLIPGKERRGVRAWTVWNRTSSVDTKGMVAHYHRDDANALLRVTLTGAVGPAEIRGLLDRQAAEHAWHYRVLYDELAADVQLSSDDILRLAEYAGTLSKVHGRRGAIAIVAATDHEYGVNRIVSAYAESVGYRIHVFRSLAAAEAWLLGHAPREN